MKKNTNRNTIDNDKIISTPSVTGSIATSESSHTTIDSGLVGTDNKDLFLHLDASKNKQETTKTMDLKPDR